MKKTNLIVIQIILLFFVTNGFANKEEAPIDSGPERQAAGQEFLSRELRIIGEKIFINETGGKREHLIYWNEHEEFPSLGIAHFIWYPEGFDGPFIASFPLFINFLKTKNVEIPDLFLSEKAPWKTRSELAEQRKNSIEIDNALTFLEESKAFQIEFIHERMQNALEKLKAASEKPDHVEQQFYRITNSKGALYPLIDYVNFKGEGVKESERYNGQGWGLLQVLESMNGNNKGFFAIQEFANKAKAVLANRVANAPKERSEDRFLAGWNNRIDTYLQ